MTFYVGQIVRLRYGHTPLQILHIRQEHNGTQFIRAKYCNKWPVSIEAFKNPHCAEGCQKRYDHEFVHWDGKHPQNANIAAFNASQRLVNFQPGMEQPMQKQFMLRTVSANRGHTDIIGTQVGITSNSHIILEFSNGAIEVQPMENLREFKQRAVKLRSVTNGQIYTFLVKAEAAFEENRYVIGENGAIYMVIDADFDYSYTPKTWFKGEKLVTQPL